MIGRLLRLGRRLSVRRLREDPLAESARILRALARRLELRAATARNGGRMPGWVQEEIRALAGIEPDLLDSLGQDVAYRNVRIPAVSSLGRTYRALMDAVGEGAVTRVLVLPWLVQGGADRGALYHLEAWVAASPARSVLLVLTEDMVSPWLERVPAGVRILQLGRIAGDMVLAEKVELLTRLLVQIKPGVVHVINSRVAWEAYSKHGLALRQASRLCASLFCDDHGHDGLPVGYARSFLRACSPHLHAVFSDNSVYPVLWNRELGIPPSLFAVLRFPYPHAVVRLRDDVQQPSAPRVLWAGRFERQKRLDVLVGIAKAMPTVGFDVYGTTGTGETEVWLQELAGLSNVRLYGAFGSFEQIVSDDHVAYLFTTAWEGMPTILLDACAAGLPIVAPAVGGVVDLLARSALIDDAGDTAAFVAELRNLVDCPVMRAERRRQQYEVLAAGRSWEDFIDTLISIPEYMPDLSSAIAEDYKKGNAS